MVVLMESQNIKLRGWYMACIDGITKYRVTRLVHGMY